MFAMIQIKRIYEPAGKKGGTRILVDRLWPRGITLKKAKMDLWLKDATPSVALCKWFSHDPKTFAEFKKRYKKELWKNGGVECLVKLAKNGSVMLLFAARDEAHNRTLVLKEFVESKV
ncbi:Uncharacterised protein [uncultured archaeon]|nr:Uncharacterised protein [uncultured archaeon]